MVQNVKLLERSRMQEIWNNPEYRNSGRIQNQICYYPEYKISWKIQNVRLWNGQKCKNSEMLLSVQLLEVSIRCQFLNDFFVKHINPNGLPGHGLNQQVLLIPFCWFIMIVLKRAKFFFFWKLCIQAIKNHYMIT